VYVHWGDEYTRAPRETDRALAHALIDFGADAIVGHHSHVIGALELYKGVPIFYSLGNLIFDQYFSPDVQEGILVELTLQEDRYVFEVIPYETYSVRSQPNVLLGEARSRVLNTLAGETEEFQTLNETGTFKLPHNTHSW
jgi:poly-gamma-glutamate synthesis protein (capsule biosynthesis protein)